MQLLRARADLIGSGAARTPPAMKTVVDIVLGDYGESTGAMFTSTREVRCYGGGAMLVLCRRLQCMDFGGGPLHNSSKLE